MQARLKIMTVMVTMVAMFAMLPALSAVAAEPLDDGNYTVIVGDQSLPMAVVDGEALVGATSGVVWQFSYDEDGRVLDEFLIVVDSATYEVEIGEDGIGYASPTDEVVVPTPTDTLADDSDSDVDEDEDAEELETEELEAEEAEAAEDGEHGALVSAVAQCAPNGREAREAGLPNHGAIVSAVAKGGEGELLSFTVPTVDSDTGTEYVITADMSADEICAVLDDAFATGTAAFEAAAEAEGEDTKGKPAKAEKAEGEAPGKSGDAPGKGKKDTEG